MTIAPSTRVEDWPEEALHLYERLLAHDFDDPSSALPFTERLARDNHWSRGFARRVVEEYRRFCFLACVENGDVTPSDQVDQAWHLHLLYTRDYWGSFTDAVLRCTLHHGPTRGGGVERQRYDDQYTRTRHAYLRWFGEHPPAAIWPSATERFSRDVRWVRVNRDDHWLLRKRGPRSLARALSVVIGVLALGLLSAAALAAALAASDPRPHTLAAAGYDPYALAAHPFLWVFALTSVGVIAACALSVRARSNAIGRGRGRGMIDTDVITTALVCGGDERALLTALTKLVNEGHLTVSRAGEIRPMDPPAASAHALERALYDEVHRHGGLSGSALFARTRLGARSVLRSLRGEAERKGLLLRRNERPAAELWAAFLFPAAFAAPRLVAALDADRPVGFLVTMLIAATIAGPALVAASRTGLTEGGLAVRARSRQRAEKLKGRRPMLAGDDLLFGAAVLGGTFLTGTALADVRQAMPQGQGGAGSGGDADSGCGGGCGGCGG